MTIKHVLYSTLITIFFVNTTLSQYTINYNKSQCTQCNMVIKDNSFSAQAIPKKGKTLTFDAIECLVNFLKTNDLENFTEFLVSDYKNPGVFLKAKKATYIQSQAIKSPMGANLAAFEDIVIAKKTQKELGGDLYSWTELLTKFNTQKTGNTSHEHHDHFRPDAHAPIGVMGDHLHKKDGLMVSFRSMNMFMDGNRFGSEHVNNEYIYENYMVAPQEMNMQMYMLGVMYAPSSRLTLMAMQNIIKKDMDLKARMMMNEMVMFRDFSTSSAGFGDLSVTALYGIYSNHKTSLHLNGSINIPIGTITQRDDTPMMNDIKLPYAMQLGSGTLDATFGATFKGATPTFSWGVQPLATIRTGKNNENYRFGDQFKLNMWGAYKLSNSFSVSTRLVGITEGDLNGQDSQLNPMMVTTADTNNYGYNLLRGFLGTNIAFAQTSIFRDLRLGLEAGIPLYRDYNGIQMDEKLTFNVGLRYDVL